MARRALTALSGGLALGAAATATAVLYGARVLNGPRQPGHAWRTVITAT